MSEILGSRLVVDGSPVAFEVGDLVAMAVLRSGDVPGRGGTLCLAGDCGNCLAIVDGVAFVRTCQVPARPGLAVARHPAGREPAPPAVDQANAVAAALAPEIVVERREADVVVIGGGDSGRRQRAEAERAGESGPRPRCGCRRRGRGDLPRADPRRPDSLGACSTSMPQEIVVATGAAEIQPVCPGNGCPGSSRARAASGRRRRRDLGPHRGDRSAAGRRAEHSSSPGGSCGSKASRRASGRSSLRTTPPAPRRRPPATPSSIDLGRAPRDLLARMAGAVAGLGGRRRGRRQPLPRTDRPGRRLPLHGHDGRRPR